MRRRRLIVVVGVVALVVIGAAWLGSGDGLSAEERLLVGVWTWVSDDGQQGHQMTFAADRRWAGRVKRPAGWVDYDSGRWAIRDGHLTIDLEGSQLYRLLRPVAPLLHLPERPLLRRTVCVESNRLTTTQLTGTYTYTRAPAD
jgi:hypothetical protein